ncbi:hypothetical protein BD408DRAFT_115149 [Parasitella parasitica]|nr:hypothetical protein BD408DRAFT_115149 [Parasitella parasitica]
MRLFSCLSCFNSSCCTKASLLNTLVDSMSSGVLRKDHHLLEATGFGTNTGIAYCTKMSVLNVKFNINLDLLLGMKLLSMATEPKRIHSFLTVCLGSQSKN